MAYPDVIEKPLSELPEGLSFTKDRWSEGWSLSKWDFAKYSINHVTDDGTEYRYTVPHSIGTLLEYQRQMGIEQQQRAILQVLGL